MGSNIFILANILTCGFVTLQVDYGDGSFTSGEFATDAVSLNSTSGEGQVVLNKIPLGCGHDNEGYDFCLLPKMARFLFNPSMVLSLFSMPYEL